MTFKEFLLEKILDKVSGISEPKILDLGSGRSKNVLEILTKHPNVHYTGVEPSKVDADFASALFKQYNKVKIINQLGYQSVAGAGEFDVCVSLSVLEHVKDLEAFLVNSAKSVKSGGVIVHLYDLGHSLHQSSLKERIQVFLSNHFIKILPESKIARYIDLDFVTQIMKENGCLRQEITYHQMPSYKHFFNIFKLDNPEKQALAEEIYEWEFKISKYLSEIDRAKREDFFPSVCLWFVKQ